MQLKSKLKDAIMAMVVCFCLVCAVLTGVSSGFRVSYVLSGLFLTGIVVGAKNILRSSGFVVAIGRLSAAIYIVHPLVRLLWPSRSIVLGVPMLDALLFFVISMSLATGYNALYARMLKLKTLKSKYL